MTAPNSVSTGTDTERQASTRVSRVRFKNFPTDAGVDTPGAEAITDDGREWRLSEWEIAAALRQCFGDAQAQRSPEQRLRAGEMVSWDRDGPIASAQAAPEYPDAPMVCAELYQVIGYIAYHYGIMEHPDVQKALDNASQHKLVHTDLLPFPKQDLPRPRDPAYASPIPRATSADAKAGWRLDFEWLDKLRDQIEETAGYQVTIECVQEAVLRTEALLLPSTDRATPPDRYVKTLEDLVQCLIDNDPDADAADGGIRVIDVWRKEAERVLSHSSTTRGPAA